MAHFELFRGMGVLGLDSAHLGPFGWRGEGVLNLDMAHFEPYEGSWTWNWPILSLFVGPGPRFGPFLPYFQGSGPEFGSCLPYFGGSGPGFGPFWAFW